MRGSKSVSKGLTALRLVPVLSVALALLVSAQGAIGQATAQDWEDVEVATIELGSGLAMLTGRGGNIGVSVGADGALLIDDQFAPLSDKILAAVEALGAKGVRFVINTHWHGDHTGGNQAFGSQGALIVAHDNVRERMSTEQVQNMRDRTLPASPAAALPVIAFGADATLHLNGHAIHAIHVPHAHTDGDALIHIADANVLHMGDIYFQGAYPYIDLDSGGSLQGVIDAVETALEIANETTQIIPGHGKLSNAAELREYRDMLIAVRDAVAAELATGKSVAEVVAAKPTAALDGEWAAGFIQPDQMVGIAATSLSAR